MVRVLHEAQTRRLAEHRAQLGLSGAELLARTDEPRYAGPAPVVDVQTHRRVGLGGRFRGDAIDLEVAVVLAAHVMLRVGFGHRAEQRELGVLQRFRIGARGRLHRSQRDYLHEMVDDDVAQRPDRIVKVSAVLHPEVLRHRDLHARDVVAVPDRLDHRVRKAQIQKLVGAHLPEEVVDPVQL